MAQLDKDAFRAPAEEVPLLEARFAAVTLAGLLRYLRLLPLSLPIDVCACRYDALIHFSECPEEVLKHATVPLAMKSECHLYLLSKLTNS